MQLPTDKLELFHLAEDYLKATYNKELFVLDPNPAVIGQFLLYAIREGKPYEVSVEELAKFREERSEALENKELGRGRDKTKDS
jgi:hypothetical protein